MMSTMNDRLTDEELDDIERDIRTMWSGEPAVVATALLAEVRALQRDLASHARDIAGLRLARDTGAAIAGVPLPV